MDAAFDKVYRQIVEVAPGLHSAGTFTPRTFEAIAKATRKLQIRNSVETGSGASTLLFSHLSEHHTVFALDGGTGSVTNVRRSPLLRQAAVTFVEGPTQVTLPQHRFTEKLQVVLIDGPHAYPFPDLEYYYLYPHLESGALLILDDIHIPTVHNLFEFLRRDRMFDLQEVVGTCILHAHERSNIQSVRGWLEATEVQCQAAFSVYMAGRDKEAFAYVNATERSANETASSTRIFSNQRGD